MPNRKTMPKEMPPKEMPEKMSPEMRHMMDMTHPEQRHAKGKA